MSHNFPCSPQGGKLNPTCCIGKTILGGIYASVIYQGLEMLIISRMRVYNHKCYIVLLTVFTGRCNKITPDLAQCRSCSLRSLM